MMLNFFNNKLKFLFKISNKCNFFLNLEIEELINLKENLLKDRSNFNEFEFIEWKFKFKV